MEEATSALRGVSLILQESGNTNKDSVKKNDDNVDTFLAFIGTKLRAIKDINIYENVEVDIINIVTQVLREERDKN